MNRIEKLVTDWMAEYTERHPVELVEVQYRKEQGNWFLRVFLDRRDGIRLEDCEQASRWLSARLDKEDPVPGKYYLEVGSAGLDRPLKEESDYERFAGKAVEVHTYAPVNGHKTFVGELAGLRDSDVVLIDSEGVEQRVPLKMVARARLHVEF